MAYFELAAVYHGQARARRELEQSADRHHVVQPRALVWQASEVEGRQGIAHPHTADSGSPGSLDHRPTQHRYQSRAAISTRTRSGAHERLVPRAYLVRSCFLN